MRRRGSLDEHHRRQVVEVPVARNLHEVNLLAAHERLHPLFRALGVVDLGPGVTLAGPVGREIPVLEAVVVLVAELQQEVVRDVRDLPPRGDVADRLASREVLDQPDALLQNVPLLLRGHGDRVLVRVAVAADLVPLIDDPLDLIRKGLDRVTGDKPRGPHVVFLEEI